MVRFLFGETAIVRLLVFLCVFTLGCSALGKPRHPNDVSDRGPYPHQYEQLVKQHFAGFLKDPYSAQYQISQPMQAQRHAGLAWGGGVVWIGYGVQVNVNAKNSWGAYVGSKPYTLLIKYGQVVNRYEGHRPILVALGPIQTPPGGHAVSPPNFEKERQALLVGQITKPLPPIQEALVILTRFEDSRPTNLQDVERLWTSVKADVTEVLYRDLETPLPPDFADEVNEVLHMYQSGLNLGAWILQRTCTQTECPFAGNDPFIQDLLQQNTILAAMVTRRPSGHGADGLLNYRTGFNIVEQQVQQKIRALLNKYPAT